MLEDSAAVALLTESRGLAGIFAGCRPCDADSRSGCSLLAWRDEPETNLYRAVLGLQTNHIAYVIALHLRFHRQAERRQW